MYLLYLVCLILAGAVAHVAAQLDSTSSAEATTTRLRTRTRTRATETIEPSAIFSLVSAFFPSATINPSQVRSWLSFFPLRLRLWSTLPSSTPPPTSSPRAQSFALVNDVNVLANTLTLPNSAIPTDAIKNFNSALRSATSPGRVRVSVGDIVDDVRTADPTVVMAEVASFVSGQPYASAATAFAAAELSVISPLYGQLRTLIASDLQQSVVPTATPASAASAASGASSTSGAPTASSSAGAPHPTGKLPVAGSAVALAVGVVGLAMM